MSLSKYYKDSKSFQPEGLIKRENSPSSSWQPQQQEEHGHFQTEEHTIITKENKQPALDSEVTEPIAADFSPPETITNTEPEKKEDHPPPAPPVKEPAIDLSKYMELTQAEEKIEQAFQQGLRTGIEKAEQDFGTASRALLSSCQQLDTIRETIIRNSSVELQEFALAIAERIIRVSVREQDRTIVATIEEALQRAVKSDEFTVYIHPEDYRVVAESAAEIIAGLTGLNKIVIKKDITVERGGAKIESDNCTIDATIAGQFDLIRAEIQKNR